MLDEEKRERDEVYMYVCMHVCMPCMYVCMYAYEREREVGHAG